MEPMVVRDGREVMPSRNGDIPDEESLLLAPLPSRGGQRCRRFRRATIFVWNIVHDGFGGMFMLVSRLVLWLRRGWSGALASVRSFLCCRWGFRRSRAWRPIESSELKDDCTMECMEAGTRCLGERLSLEGPGLGVHDSQSESLLVTDITSGRGKSVPSISAENINDLQVASSTCTSATDSFSPTSPKIRIESEDIPHDCASPASAGCSTDVPETASHELPGDEGSQCALCGHTIEEGDAVTMSPVCADKIKVSAKL